MCLFLGLTACSDSVSDFQEEVFPSDAEIIELSDTVFVGSAEDLDSYDILQFKQKVSGDRLPVKSVEKSRTRKNAKLANHPSGIDIYEVRALFQSLENPGKKYLARYTAAVEPALVKVEYRRDGGWREPHDNIPLTYHYIIYRDRYYDNGEIYTDTFNSGNTGVEWVMGCYPGVGQESERPAYTYTQKREETDYGWTVYATTGVPDLDGIYLNRTFMRDYGGIHGAWEDYSLMGYADNFNPMQPISGWYFNDIEICKLTIDLREMEGERYIRRYECLLAFYDDFRYLDGRIFDFMDYIPDVKTEVSMTETTREPYGRVKIVRVICKYTHLGRDFKWEFEDIVYQL